MKNNLVDIERLPDLIVSDYRLRGDENGIEVVEMPRGELNIDMPALLVTGDTAPDRLRDAHASGLPILRKPLNPARLRTLIANLLREHTRAARGPPRCLKGPFGHRFRQILSVGTCCVFSADCSGMVTFRSAPLYSLPLHH
jgi:DNA-binding response OmpR family regulator